MTYMALSAGYRGLTFMGDADLTRPSAEPLLIEMSFLNAEIDLCEQILARNFKTGQALRNRGPKTLGSADDGQLNQKRMPKVAGTSRQARPDREHRSPCDNSRGFLLLVTDFAAGAQWQPPQMAYRNLVITPSCPSGAQILEIQPRRRSISRVEVRRPRPRGHSDYPPGFRHVDDPPLHDRHRASAGKSRSIVQKIRPQAIALAIRQAEIVYKRCQGSPQATQGRRAWHPQQEGPEAPRRPGDQNGPPDAEDLLAEADKFLKNARAAQRKRRITPGPGRRLAAEPVNRSAC